jgi:hypothetical protein
LRVIPSFQNDHRNLILLKGENFMSNYLASIDNYSTKELVEELLKKEGVEQMTVAPHKKFNIIIEENWEGKRDSTEQEGCARILIIID